MRVTLKPEYTTYHQPVLTLHNGLNSRINTNKTCYGLEVITNTQKMTELLVLELMLSIDRITKKR